MATIDEVIGFKIRTIRKRWGMSQIELAERIDLSFQQVQKYEKGTTRMSVFRLQQIAGALEVPISVFFEEEGARPSQVADPKVEYRGGPGELPPQANKEGAVLLKLFRQIKNKKMRKGILNLLRGITELHDKH